MKIILSASQAVNSVHANTAATSNMALFLKSSGYTHQPVIGCYKGNRETSFMVSVGTPKESQAILKLATRFNQECVLRFLDDGSNVVCIHPDGTQHALEGTFKQVLTIKGMDAYTIINGELFAVS